MQRLLGGLTLALACAVLLFGGVPRAQEKSEPTVVIEEMRHDMGEVFEQDKYVHVFKVKNTGNVDLEIISVKPG